MMNRDELHRRWVQAERILLVLPMALGDFCYQHLVIGAVQARYPGKMWDVMFDEAFHTNRFHQGGGKLVNPIICEWAEDTRLFRHVYTEMYRGTSVADCMTTARAAAYDVVIALSGRGQLQVLRACRTIAPQAVLMAWEPETCWWKLGRDVREYRRIVDAEIPFIVEKGGHIIDSYLRFFRVFAEVEADWAQVPQMTVPDAARSSAAKVLAEYGVTSDTPVIFINAFAKNRKRTWPLSHVAKLVQLLSQDAPWTDAIWLVNGMPDDRAAVETMIRRSDGTRMHFFSATEGFWELPAMLAGSDLVISVETSVMHLASLLHRPQVVLMRQKAPHWRPLRREDCTIVTTRRRRDTMSAITPDEVAAAVRKQYGSSRVSLEENGQDRR